MEARVKELIEAARISDPDKSVRDLLVALIVQNEETNQLLVDIKDELRRFRQHDTHHL
jgi:hypothetical protein